MKRNTAEAVAIEKIVNGGYGLTQLNSGKKALVLNTLPGETVSFKTLEQRSKVCYGIGSAVLEQRHPGRISPPCPYYMACGGCNLQHSDYEAQLAIKLSILSDLLKRSASQQLKDFADTIEPVLESDEIFGYRQRIRLKVSPDEGIGFNRFRSNTIVPVDKCLLAPQPINQCLESLLDVPAFKRLQPVTTELELLINPDDRSLCLIMDLARKPRPTDRKTAHTLSSELGGLRVFFGGNEFAIEGPFVDSDKPLDNLLKFALAGKQTIYLTWEAGGFCQVNLGQNRKLVEVVMKFCDIQPSDHVLDLYSGMGNFSIPAAFKCEKVVGVESQGSGIRSGRRNVEINNLSNIQFIKSDVAEGCRQLMRDGAVFDIVISDPPRQGMADITPFLNRLVRKRLVYISCDSATLCRDLVSLCTSGFTLKKLQPVDMFPQTHHLETVALLEKDQQS